MSKENQLLIKDVEMFDIDFQTLKPSDFEEGLSISLEKSIDEFNHINKIKNHTFEQLFHYPEASRLLAIFNLLGTLNGLVNNEEYRNIFEKYNEKLTLQFLEWNFDKKNYRNLEAYSRGDDFQKQPIIRQKIVLKTISDLRRSGINLPNNEQRKFKKVSQKLSNLVMKFSNNVTDSQNELRFVVNKNALKGLSDRAIKNIEHVSKQNNLPEGKYLIDELSGSLSEVMSDVRNQGIRKKIYNARKNRCLKGKYNTTKLIEQIYKLKQESAHILGYDSVAHEVLVDNMAGTPDAVKKFIDELGNAALPHAREQFNELKNFGESLLKRPMQAWDVSYVSKKMEKKQAKLDSELIREYLPVKHVIQALFDFCEEKFGITFKETEKVAWHEDVKLFNVYENGVLVGSLYMDLYMREGKRPGAWLSPICTARNNTCSKKDAVALLVCNAPKDISNPTFTLDEVVTLFHEMGHALHHLLSKVSEEFYSGFNHVEHDAVEFPSQLLDMFVYNEDVLRRISKHIETGKPLSNSLIAKIKDSKRFLGALQIMRTLQFSDMDITLYLQKDKHPFEVEREIKEKWAVNPHQDKDNYMMKTFMHIFCGGYSAGYYGYQWAEVLSADAYQYLTEKVSRKESQKRFNDYKQYVLYTGGEQSMRNNYYDFTHFEPNVQSLIAQYIK